MALDNDKSENSEESVQDAMSTFERVIQILAEDITLLHQLSNTIRRAGRESQNSKSAAYFEIKDNDGNNIEDALQAAFLHNLLDQFPNSEESLLARLASTMVVRRKQILYRRSRRPKAVKSLPGIIPKSTFSLAPEEPVTVYLMASDDDCTVQRFQREAAATPHKPKFSVVQSQAKTTTTLDLEKLRQASTPSVISGTRTISLRQDNNLVFPPPPRASIRDRFNQLKSRHRDERDAQLALLPNYALYIENKENQSLEPPVFEKLMEQVQEVHKQYHMAVEADRKACDTMETEAICPYCLETLSSGKMKDLRKWR